MARLRRIRHHLQIAHVYRIRLHVVSMRLFHCRQGPLGENFCLITLFCEEGFGFVVALCRSSLKSRVGKPGGVRRVWVLTIQSCVLRVAATTSGCWEECVNAYIKPFASAIELLGKL